MKHASLESRRLCTAVAIALVCAALLVGCSSSGGLRQTIGQTTSARMTIAKTALATVGDTYAEHMAGPDQFDDSGLVYYVYRRNGHALPRSLADQLDTGIPISLPQAEPGDLVFFRVNDSGGRAHLTVGVMIDDTLAVLALPGRQAEQGGVRRVSLQKGYWAERMVGVIRILPDESPE